MMDEGIGEVESPKVAGIETKQSQVGHQFDLLEKANDRLIKTVIRLEDALASVLTGELEKVNPEKSDTPELTPLANTIKARESEVCNANKKLRSIMDRLEL